MGERNLKKYKSLFGTFTFLVIILTGCSNNLGKVIVSEKTVPSDIREIWSRRENSPNIPSLVYRLTNDAQLEEAWNYYSMENRAPDLDYESNEYYFVSVFESSSCPYKLKNTTVNNYTKEIVFYLHYDDGGCNTDATPKTFVIEIDKTIAKNLKNASIVYISGNHERRTTEQIRE